MPFTLAIQQLIENSVQLHRQAIAHLHTGEISHYEILSRFKQEGSQHSPQDFVLWLERHELIHFLDRHIIAQVLHHVATNGLKERYAVNLSAGTINQNGQFTKFLAAQRATYALRELPLVLEITERVAIANTAIAQSVLSFIRAIGCPLAVDDFGSPDGGFSVTSLDLLKPVYLKIDGSYTQRLPEPSAIADINAYCAIAHSRGIKVILEKVEPQHLDIVRDSTAVDLIQGWAIGKPEPLSSS